MARKPAPKVPTFTNPPQNQGKAPIPVGDPAPTPGQPDVPVTIQWDPNGPRTWNSPFGRRVAAAAAAAGTGGADSPAYDPYAAMAAAQNAQREKNAIATIKAMLDQFNLSGLYDVIVGYVKEGYDASTVMALIRSTPQYKQRFPAMEALAKKGRAISEATYIDYERGASSLEQRYGLPKGMLTGNVTNLLDADVSTLELNDRVALASSASLQAPQELKDTLSNYYGIGQGGLTAYFLDPSVAMPLLERQYATAQIGTEALRQDVGLDVGIATQLQEMGVTQEQARAGFYDVSRQAEFTAGRGDVTSQENLIMGNVGKQASAQQEIERIASSRVARFQGGGGFINPYQGSKSGLQQSSV